MRSLALRCQPFDAATPRAPCVALRYTSQAMPALPADAPLSYEEYLRFEESVDSRHEFIDGDILAMAGGTRRHAVLKSRLATELTIGLGKDAPCGVEDSDTRVVVERGSNLNAYRPDMTFAEKADPSARPRWRRRQSHARRRGHESKHGEAGPRSEARRLSAPSILARVPHRLPRSPRVRGVVSRERRCRLDAARLHRGSGRAPPPGGLRRRGRSVQGPASPSLSEPRDVGCRSRAT